MTVVSSLNETSAEQLKLMAILSRGRGRLEHESRPFSCRGRASPSKRRGGFRAQARARAERPVCVGRLVGSSLG